MTIELRLEKFMAQSGVASRRGAKELVIAGRVKINGKQVFIPGRHINPKKDRIELDGKSIGKTPKPIYLMLNKPAGYLTTTHDEHNRHTVMELLSEIDQRIFPIGRLDRATEGLLLLTNDGDFSHHILHPSHEVDKTYVAWVKGIPSAGKIKQLRQGIRILTGVTSPATVRSIGVKGKSSGFEVIIHEGKKRQIRRMFGAIGHDVTHLKRIKIGSLKLGNLPIGRYRKLTKKEVKAFYV